MVDMTASMGPNSLQARMRLPAQASHDAPPSMWRRAVDPSIIWLQMKQSALRMKQALSESVFKPGLNMKRDLECLGLQRSQR
jgi:hypothetical protein